MTIAERIAALPTAVNTLELFQAKLTQGYVPQEEKTGSQETGNIGWRGEKGVDSDWRTADQSKLTASLFAVDNDRYTKEDAINKQWRKLNTHNVEDLFDGTADMSNLGLSMSEVERRIKEGNLLDGVDDIDLSMLKFEFRGVEFRSASIGPGEFNKKAEYLASRYAAMEDKIRNTYSGTEQKARLHELDTIYGNALERAAKEYSETVGNLLGKYGVAGETEKIYESFKNGVEERVSEYRDFLKKNPGFIGVEATEDAWLAKDDEYVAARLREQAAFSKEGKESGGYTLKDLDALGQYACGLAAMEKKANVYDMNEERMGIDLAVLAMKTDKLAKAEGISKGLAATLQKALDGFLSSYVDGMKDRMEEARQKGGTVYDGRGFAALDESAVRKVYDRTMREYRLYGDMMRALIKGAEYGKQQYTEKVQSGQVNGVYRYRNGASYWNNFFGSASDMKNGSYNKTGSTYEQYMVGWLEFASSLKEGKGVRMNLVLNSSALSVASQLGSLLNKNA